MIVGLRLSELSVSGTFRVLKEHDIQRSERTIGRVFSEGKNDEKTSSAIKSNSGRKKCLTDDGSLNYLAQSIKDNPYQSKNDLFEQPIANPQRVRGQTLINNLKENGFSQQSVQKKIEISEKNKIKRVQSAKSLLRNQKKSFKQTDYLFR